MKSSGSKISKMQKRALSAAFAGAFIEWYDFYLFGTAAALVFPTVFFHDADPTVALIQSFGGFAAGFLTRPIGAVVFGHFGDRIGRKPMLLITVLMMGVCTVLIGVLPTYSTIGIAAPFLLYALRLIQGIGIGGEFGGGALTAVENAPKEKRGLFGSFHQLGTPAGLLVSTGVFSLVQMLPNEQFLAWGWRIPFLLAGPLLGVAVYIRAHLPETETFKAAEKSKEKKIPFFKLIAENPKNLLLGIGARMADAVTFNVINVFGIAFATQHLGVSKAVMLNGFVVSSAVQMLILPACGKLSDRIGRKATYLSGIGISALGVMMYFPVIQLNSTILTWSIIVLTHAVGTGLMFSIQGTLFAELFGTEMRYTGLGVVYQTSALLGGAPTPALVTALVAAASFSVLPAASYVVAMCVLSAICVYFASVKQNENLDEI